MHRYIEVRFSWLASGISLKLPDSYVGQEMLEKTCDYISEVRRMHPTSTFATEAERVDDVLDLLSRTEIAESKMHSGASSVGPYGPCGMPPTVMPSQGVRRPFTRLSPLYTDFQQHIAELLRSAAPLQARATSNEAAPCSGFESWPGSVLDVLDAHCLQDTETSLEHAANQGANLSNDLPSLGLPAAPGIPVDLLAELPTRLAPPQHASAFSDTPVPSNGPVHQQVEPLGVLAAPGPKEGRDLGGDHVAHHERPRAMPNGSTAARSPQNLSRNQIAVSPQPRPSSSFGDSRNRVAVPSQPRPSSTFGDGRSRGALSTQVFRAGRESSSCSRNS